MSAPIDLSLEKLTQRVIGCAFTVAGALGRGFLENVYRRALLVEFRRQDMVADEEVPFKISYCGQAVGTYVADLVVGRCLIVELKAVEALTNAHKGQVINYLRASGLPVGLLINFGRPKIEVRRVLA